MTIEQSVKKAERTMPRSKESEAADDSSSPEKDPTIRGHAEIKDKAKGKYLPPIETEKKGILAKIKSIAKNAYSNTIKFPVSKYQNYKTEKYLGENPDTDKRLNIIVNGLCQNIGANAQMGKDANERGELAYHLHAGHGLFKIKHPKKRAENVYKGLNKLKAKTKIDDKTFKKLPKDYLGHSSGGDLGQYIAADDRAKHEYGIDRIYTVASTGGALEPKTPAQRALKLILPSAMKDEDPTKSKKARQNVIDMYHRKPKIPVYNIYGANDDLVPRDKIIPYMHSTAEAIIAHRDSDHFDTSFQNSKMNNAILDLKEIMPEYKGRLQKEKGKKAIAYYV